MNSRLVIPVVFVVVLCGSVVWWFVSQSEVSKEEGNTQTTGSTTFPISNPGVQPVPTPTSYSPEQFMGAFFADLAGNNKWYDYTTSTTTLPLKQALSLMKVTVEPRLLTLLDSNEWRLYSCTDTSSESRRKDVVLSMRFALQKNYQGNLYYDQVLSLGMWEASFVKNVSPFLFPKEYYDSVPVQKGMFTADASNAHITLRTVSVEFPDTTRQTIGYIFVGDELLVGNNVECLLRAQEQVFDTSA